ncbi:hypothetical protein AB0E78_25290 [Streptomyces sp. NPDC032198]|uniref:hypothetical protein n=1 Tax=Streptomyces sp. NPDC032198 TaxID=3155127 RepID=UPI003401C7A9
MDGGGGGGGGGGDLDAIVLAPSATAWLERGITQEAVRRTLTAALPTTPTERTLLHRDHGFETIARCTGQPTLFLGPRPPES